MAADIANFSGRVSVNETHAFGNLSSILKIGREELATHDGNLIGMPGDGLFALFESAVDAIHCALAIQERLSMMQNLGGMRLRIGIHVGDVLFDGDLPFGETLNIASRLESLADPGGILISGTMVDAVSARISATFEDRGVPRLKNIPRRITTYAVHPTGADSASEAGAPSRPQLDKTMRIPGKDNEATPANSLQERLAASQMAPDPAPTAIARAKQPTPTSEPESQPAAETKTEEIGKAKAETKPQSKPSPETETETDTTTEKKDEPQPTDNPAINPLPEISLTSDTAHQEDPSALDDTVELPPRPSGDHSGEPNWKPPLNDAQPTPEDLAQIVEAMSVHLGPVARVMVQRKAKTNPSIGALIEELLGELSNGDERADVRSRLLDLIRR